MKTDRRRCPVCEGAGHVPDYNEALWRIVRRTCPCCKGQPWPPISERKPRKRVYTDNPTRPLAVAAVDYRAYVRACRGSGHEPSKRGTYDSWRRRQRQIDSGAALT
jgi:hypothetical protein